MWLTCSENDTTDMRMIITDSNDNLWGAVYVQSRYIYHVTVLIGLPQNISWFLNYTDICRCEENDSAIRNTV